MDLSKLTPAPWEPFYADGDPTKEILSIDHPRPDLAEKYPPDRYGPAMRRDLLLLSPRDGIKPDDAEFICLARNAFDVMHRRGWTVTRWGYGDSEGAWGVVTTKLEWPHELLGWGPIGNSYSDPFTALVEADKWLTQEESERDY